MLGILSVQTRLRRLESLQIMGVKRVDDHAAADDGDDDHDDDSVSIGEDDGDGHNSHHHRLPHYRHHINMSSSPA